MPQLGQALALTLLIWSLTAVGHAQPVAAAAEVLFRAGREALQRGDAETACAKFRESYRLEPALGTLLNIGVCEEAVGELCNAWQHFQEVIHALAADDDRVGIANQHLQQLEPRLPRLTVHRSVDSPDDTHALIGGVALGAASFDVALPMDPGKYTVEAAADGRATRSYPIELHEGDQLELQLEPGGPLPPVAATAHDTSGVSSPAMQSPGPAAAAPADMGSRPASGPSARRLVAYTLLGASGVSLITAAISAGLMLDRQATVDANCVSSACNPQGWAALQEFRTFRVLGISALSVGVATGGTALFLLLTEPRAHNPKIAIQPVLAPTAIGLRFRAAL